MAHDSFTKRGFQPAVSNIDNSQLIINWENVICPICFEFPHHCVLLQCSSYEKGCRPFVCDTNHFLSNCLERYKTACGLSSPSTSDESLSINTEPIVTDTQQHPSCPLCRGDVTGWIVIDEARVYLDEKKRCCEEERCTFKGTFSELQKHAEIEHPDAQPSKIDPARQLDWENFQQSFEIIDVLSTIHSEVPHGVVLGDYVIEYGDEETTDEFEDFPGDDGNWWTSCILYQVFDNFRSSRNRRRSRVGDARRGRHRLSFDTSNSDDGSVTSVDFRDHRVDDIDDDFIGTSSGSQSGSSHRRSYIFLSLYFSMNVYYCFLIFCNCQTSLLLAVAFI